MEEQATVVEGAGRGATLYTPAVHAVDLTHHLVLALDPGRAHARVLLHTRLIQGIHVAGAGATREAGEGGATVGTISGTAGPGLPCLPETIDFIPSDLLAHHSTYYCVSSSLLIVIYNKTSRLIRIIVNSFTELGLVVGAEWAIEVLLAQ